MKKLYAKITRYGRIQKKEKYKLGTYIQPIDLIKHAIDGEFDSVEIGDTLEIQIIEITEEEYNKLPEFQGY